MAGIIRRAWEAMGGKASEELGIVYPSPNSGQYVDVPVLGPQGWTTAWSNGVPVLDPGVPLTEYTARDVAAGTVWRTQPNVRKVVGFIARTVGTIPFKLYERAGEDDRRQIRDHVLARALRSPQGPHQQGASAFWQGLVGDSLVYDRWAAMKVPQDDGSLRLTRIPARLLAFRTNALDEVQQIRVWSVLEREGQRWGYRDYDLDMFIWGTGYNPNSGAGLTPMQTLADVLAESAEAVRFRRQQWANGARVSGWIERPIEADEKFEGWDDAARRRFLEDFDSRYRGKGASDPGGIPLLEEGMKLHEGKAFSPQDAMDLEGRKLTAIEVASFYHIAPELVGARQGNYSNVREYRQMLYRDSLGPYIQTFEEALNAQLLPEYEPPGRAFYIEAHVETKLRGSFEEQAEFKSKAVGVPWLTINEARALENRPAVEGGDVIPKPVNYFYDDEAGPEPAGPGEPNEPEEPAGEDDVAQLEAAARRTLDAKAKTTPVRATVNADKLTEEYAKALRKFAERQGRAVLSALGAKALEDGAPPLASAWDGDRWDTELGRLMFQHIKRAAELEGALIAAMVGLESYDPDQLDEWVRKMVAAAAHPWNQATYDDLAEALRDGEEWKERAAEVFEKAGGHRAELAAAGGIKAAIELAKVDTGRRGGWNRKTWRTRSNNPRSSHARMNGETVHIDAAFSNGAQWPGDASLPEDERAGCKCEVELFRED